MGYEVYSVKEVFDACERVLKKKTHVEVKGRRAGDPAILYADIGKVKSILDWKSEKSLEESIKSAYLWYINSINKK